MEGSHAAGKPKEPALPFVFLALIVVLVAGLLAVRGLGSHYVTADEAASIALGRSIAGDPASLFTEFFKAAVDTGRGIERGVPVMAALADLSGLSGNAQLQVLRAFMCLAQGLVAVPIFALARELGLTRWQALVPAAVGSSGAFAFFGIFALSTSLGVLAFVMFLWTLLWSLRKPGLASDAAVVVTFLALLVIRLGWAPLALCGVPAICAWYWFARPRGEALRVFLRRFPRALFQDHLLLTSLALAAALLLVIFAGSSFEGAVLGGYMTIAGEGFGWDQVARSAPEIVAHLAVGLAIVPFVLGVSWVAANLFGPRKPSDGAFSWLMVALPLVFGFVYLRWAAIADSAIEDRYLAALVPPFAVAGGLAVFRRPSPQWWLAGVAAALTTWLGVVGYRVPRLGPFDFFVAPTSVFFEQVVLGRGSELLGLGGRGLAAAVFFAAGALSVLAVLAAARLPQRLAGLFLWAVLAGVLVFQLSALEHPARKFTGLLGMKGLPSGDLEFVDRSSPDGDVAVVAPDGILPPSVAAQLPGLQTFNRSVKGSWILGVGPATPEIARVDLASGFINHPPAPPRQLLFKSGFTAYGIAGRELRVPPAFAFVRMVRPARPLRVDWLITGASPDGYSIPGTPLQLTAYARGRRGLCVGGNVLSDPRLPDPVTYRLTGPEYRSSGSVQGGQPRAFRARVAGADPVVFRLKSSYSKLPDGSEVGAGLFDISLVPCR